MRLRLESPPDCWKQDLQRILDSEGVTLEVLAQQRSLYGTWCKGRLYYRLRTELKPQPSWWNISDLTGRRSHAGCLTTARKWALANGRAWPC